MLAELSEPTIVPAWCKSYLDYMLKGVLPEDTVEACRITRCSKAFTIIKSELYKRNIYDILQRCISPEAVKDILLDIHVGTYGHHASSRALVAKAF